MLRSSTKGFHMRFFFNRLSAGVFVTGMLLYFAWRFFLPVIALAIATALFSLAIVIVQRQRQRPVAHEDRLVLAGAATGAVAAFLLITGRVYTGKISLALMLIAGLTYIVVDTASPKKQKK